MGLIERLRHTSQNCGDEYLHEVTGRADDALERLAKYAKHGPMCLTLGKHDCRCGLSDLLKDIGE